jgi:hypothetical protein
MKTTKNITVKVSSEAYRDARVWAAAHGASVSAIVQHVIQNLPNLKAVSAAVDALSRKRQEALAADPNPERSIQSELRPVTRGVPPSAERLLDFFSSKSGATVHAAKSAG